MCVFFTAVTILMSTISCTQIDINTINTEPCEFYAEIENILTSDMSQDKNVRQTTGRCLLSCKHL